VSSPLAYEGEALGVHVEDDRPGSCQLGELHGGEADRTRADHKGRLS
jgi:hypothetical protein